MTQLASYTYPKVAYFSMEVGLMTKLPTYSGGLGVLAGDTLKAGADQAIPMVGVTLLHRKGYINQHLDAKGEQTETPVQWEPRELLTPLNVKAQVEIQGRTVHLTAWKFDIKGVRGHKVPVYYLDTDLEENTAEDRKLTDHLYGGDQTYRIAQEILLGMGGVKILDEIGHTNLDVYHMNEGHAAFLTLELLNQEKKGAKTATKQMIETVRKKCVFTTHTPVPAGHDQFSLDMVEKYLGAATTKELIALECAGKDTLNMTNLALFFSRYINGVAMRHGQVSQTMFPKYPINSVTNGVHANTWTTPSFKKLFDEYIPQWEKQNVNLRHAVSIPHQRVWSAHKEVKAQLIKLVKEKTGAEFKEDVFTIGFARRATAYKRADLFFSDLERLKSIAAKMPIQVIYSGKAHPKDEGGKKLIQKIYQASEKLKDQIQVVYIQNYDMDIAHVLCTGVDIWLNTPEKPHEASGTSGMKSALNGVPSLSVLDGWWIEGHLEGVTGWSIGESVDEEITRDEEALSLYNKLENQILPMYYERPGDYVRVMLNSIAYNGSFFNTQRMIVQYNDIAYRQVVAE